MHIFPLFQITSVPATSHRKRLNNPDSFCYICGSFIIPCQKTNISAFVEQAYFAYFKVKRGDQDKASVPHKVCKQYFENLQIITKGTHEKLAFGIPMV